MSEVKAEYRVTTDAVAHGREFRCGCGKTLWGYLRAAGNWTVLLRTNGEIEIGEKWLYCKECGEHRHWVRVARTDARDKPIPAFLDPTRDRKREDIEQLKREARKLAGYIIGK